MTMQLTVVTGRDEPGCPLYHVHAAGCADLRKVAYRGAELKETADWPSVQAIAEDFYCHQIEESDDGDWRPYADDFRVFPCASGLPTETPA